MHFQLSVIKNTSGQERRQNFGSGDIQQKITQRRLLKIFLENVYKIRTKI